MTVPTVETDPVRALCYQRIRDCMKAGLQLYYQERPSLLMDERSEEAIEYSLRGLVNIFKVLDGYNITVRDEKP